MSTFGWIVLGVIVVAVLIAISPPFRRFWKAIKEKGEVAADEAAEALRRQNPMGYYNLQINNAVENGKNAQNVVKAAAKQLVSLDNQIADDLKEQTRLNSRIKSALTKGDPNKTANSYALQLAAVEQNLQTNQAQRVAQQKVYDDNLKMVEKYERDVTQARRDADQLGFQLEQSKAEKELVEMSASLRTDLNLGELAQAKKRVQDQINANRGDTKAVSDLSRQGLAEDLDEEDERQGAADEILARFQPKPAPNAGSPSASVSND